MFGLCRCKVCWSHHVFIWKPCQHVSVVASFCTQQAFRDPAAARVLVAISHFVLCWHVVWIEGAQTLSIPRFSDEWYCLFVFVYVTGRDGWAEWWTPFVVWSLQRENHDVLVIRRILRRWTWIRLCVLILMRRRERTFTVVLCYALMIDWVIVWDVAVLWFEMCPFWCVGGDVYRTISSYYVSVFSIYFLCVRVFGVASLYFCFNFVLDLICSRLHVFPEVCICKWRVLN